MFDTVCLMGGHVELERGVTVRMPTKYGEFDAVCFTEVASSGAGPTRYGPPICLRVRNVWDSRTCHCLLPGSSSAAQLLRFDTLPRRGAILPGSQPDLLKSVARPPHYYVSRPANSRKIMCVRSILFFVVYDPKFFLTRCRTQATKLEHLVLASQGDVRFQCANEKICACARAECAFLSTLGARSVGGNTSFCLVYTPKPFWKELQRTREYSQLRGVAPLGTSTSPTSTSTSIDNHDVVITHPKRRLSFFFSLKATKGERRLEPRERERERDDLFDKKRETD